MEFEEGDLVRVSSNRELRGNKDLIVVDYADLDKKIKAGDSIVFNYGKLELIVERVEQEDAFIKKSQKFKQSKGVSSKDLLVSSKKTSAVEAPKTKKSLDFNSFLEDLNVEPMIPEPTLPDIFVQQVIPECEELNLEAAEQLPTVSFKIPNIDIK